MTFNRCQAKVNGRQCFKQHQHPGPHDTPMQTTVDSQWSPFGPPIPGTFTTTAIGSQTPPPDLKVVIVPWTICCTPKNWGAYGGEGESGWYAAAGIDYPFKVSANGEGATEREAARNAEQALFVALRDMDVSTLSPTDLSARDHALGLLEERLDPEFHDDLARRIRAAKPDNDGSAP